MMEQNILLSKINELINTLQLQSESISSQPDMVYRIDIESLKRNTIKLYDLIHLLKPVGTTFQDNHTDNFSGGNHATIPMEIAPKPAPEIGFTQPDKSIISDKPYVAPEKDPTSERSQNEMQLVDESFLDPIDEDVFEDQEVAVDQDNEFPNKFTVTESLPNPVFTNTLDLFEETAPASLGDLFATADDVSISAHIQHKKIDDLRNAIGINEKFLFINELFGGNLKQYQNAIEELNNFKSLSGIHTYLIELGVQYQWPAHSPALLRLKELIERKF